MARSRRRRALCCDSRGLLAGKSVRSLISLYAVLKASTVAEGGALANNETARAPKRAYGAPERRHGHQECRAGSRTLIGQQPHLLQGLAELRCRGVEAAPQILNRRSLVRDRGVRVGEAQLGGLQPDAQLAQLAGFISYIFGAWSCVVTGGNARCNSAGSMAQPPVLRRVARK